MSLRLKLSSHQWMFVLFIIGLFVITFTVILPILCHRMVYSPYFVTTQNDPNVVRKVVLANDERYAAARIYIQKMTEEGLLSQAVKDKPSNQESDVTIGIITVNRDRAGLTGLYQNLLNLGYLTQTVAHLLKIVVDDSSFNLKWNNVFVCNVDPQPELFTEALGLSSVVRIISRFRNASAQEMAISSLELFDKEKDDYAFCLEMASQFNTQYVLLLEDDVLLAHNAFIILSQLMTRSHLNTDSNWLFVKLYYPEKWQGFGNDFETFVELCGIAAVGGSLTCLIAVLAMKHFNWRTIHRYPMLVLFTVGAMYAVLLCLGLGRPYLISLRHHFVSTHRLISARGCCTQAVIYPSRQVMKLVKHLRRVHCTIDFSVDIAIDGYAHSHRLDGYLIEPNVLKHIGLLSTVRDYSKSAEYF